MHTPESSIGYRATQDFVVRMPMWYREKFADLSTYQDILEALPSILRDSRLKLALRISSPSLAEQLERVAEKPVNEHDPKTRRAARSLRKYLIRMTRRSTPFGLMSGVAMGQFGDQSSLEPKPIVAQTIEVFPDYAWLMSVVADIAKQDTDGILPTTLNPYIHQLGERLDIAHANAFGLAESVHVDLRATSATDMVVELAKKGASRREMIELLFANYDDVDRDTVVDFVDNLARSGVIAEKLQAGLVPGRELCVILATLKKSPDLDERRQALNDVDQLCQSIATIDELNSKWEQICEAQDRALSQVGTTDRVSVNSTLNLQDVTLHKNVSRRVEELANLLSGTNFFPHRVPYLVEYEHHFLERYGVEGEVSILELLSAGRGLEAPNTYRLPSRTYPLASPPRENREQRAAALIDAYIQALQSGTRLELSDKLLAAYVSTDFRPPNPSLEYFVRVIAPSRASIDQDDFDLFVVPDGLAQGGRSIGRFTGLLGQSVRGLAREIFDHEKAQSGTDALLVQLRYMPDKARMANVARTADLGALILALGTAEESALRLNDVLVGNDGSRFYLRDASSGRRLRIVENHMLSPLNAPNVVRLMLDLSNDWYRSFNMFDWGVLREAAFLPRVGRGRTILSPAQWNVKQDTLQTLHRASQSSRVDQLRASLRLPDEVFFVLGDNRLPLDLRTEIDREILDEEIARAQKSGDGLHLEEVVGGQNREAAQTLSNDASELGAPCWLSDAAGNSYDHEFVVPVIWVDSEDGMTSSPVATSRKTVIARNSYEWDACWVCLDVYGGLQNLDTVVGLDFADLRDATRSFATTWFFIRYSIPAHRLRIRLRANSESDVEPIRSALIGWAGQLLERSLIYDYGLVSFVPEINRFGGELAYDKALSVFTTSSVLARFISQLRITSLLGKVQDDIVGVFMLAVCRDGIHLSPGELSPSPSKGQEFREYYRSSRKQLLDVIMNGRIQGLDETSQFKLQQLASTMAGAMAEYSSTLSRERLNSALKQSALASMIHMMFNRTFPIGNAVEQRSLDLWALASDALERRIRALSGAEAGASGTETSGRSETKVE